MIISDLTSQQPATMKFECEDSPGERRGARSHPKKKMFVIFFIFFSLTLKKSNQQGFLFGGQA